MRKSHHSLSHDLYRAVTHDLIGGLVREAGRQVFGFTPAKKKKQTQTGTVHNHYHVHPDKKYYKAK